MATIYARALVRLSGSAPQHGGVVATASSRVELVPESTVGWRKQKWEIYSYPLGFPIPPGWAVDGEGVLVSTDVRPPAFDLPTATSGIWGKWFIRLRVDGAVDATDVDPLLVDEATAIPLPSPNGVEDVGWLEEAQFGGNRGWTAALSRALRALDRFVTTGSVSAAAGGDLDGSYPAPTVRRLTGVLDAVRILAKRIQWDAGLFAVGSGQDQARSGPGNARLECSQAAATGSNGRGGDFLLVLGRSDGGALPPRLRVAYEVNPEGGTLDAVVISPDDHGGGVISPGDPAATLALATGDGVVRARVRDGSLRISAPILGEPAQLDPLRLGYARILVDNASIVDVKPDQFACQVLEFHGRIHGPCSVMLPKVPGYAKLIIHSLGDDYPFRVQVPGGQGVVLPEGQEWVFCDGNDIRKSKTNRAVSFTSATFGGNYLNREFFTTSATFVDVTGLAISFLHAEPSDLVDCCFRVTLESTSALGEGRLVFSEAGGAFEFPKAESLVQVGASNGGGVVQATIPILHLPTNAGRLQIRFQVRRIAGSGVVYVNSPSSLTLRRYRP